MTIFDGFLDDSMLLIDEKAALLNYENEMPLFIIQSQTWLRLII